MDTKEDEDLDQLHRGDQIDEWANPARHYEDILQPGGPDGSHDKLNLRDAENRKFDDIRKYINNDASDPNALRDNVAGMEKKDPTTAITHSVDLQPGPIGNVSRLAKSVSFLKKNKGVAGLVGVLTTGVVLLISFFGPASILPNFVQNLDITNNRIATSFGSRFPKAFQYNTLNNAECGNTGSVTIKKSLGCISNKALDKLHKKGVIANVDGGDYTPGKTGYPSANPDSYRVEFDDGTPPRTITANELPDLLTQSENYKITKKFLGIGGAFNLRVRSWFGKHISNRLYVPFRLSRDGGAARTTNKLLANLEARLAAFRDSIPGGERIASAKTAISTRLRANLGRINKAGIAYTLGVAGCMVIKAPAFFAAAVAGVQLMQLMPMIMESVLSPASMLQAAGYDNQFSQEGMETAGELITERVPRESDGELRAAVDSPYFLKALGVIKTRLSPSAEFTPGLAILNDPLSQAAGAADDATKAGCTALMSPGAMYTAMAADMAATLLSSFTVIGGVIKIVGSFILQQVVSEVVMAVLNNGVGAALQSLAENKAIETAKGEKLGDVLGIGAIAFFASGAMARHLPALSKSQLASASVTQEKALQVEKELAIESLSPFDTSSRYTFLGSIVHNMQFAMLSTGNYNNSAFAIAANLIRLPSVAMAAVMPRANASLDLLRSQCDYAEEFGLSTGNDATTPAVNIAGLPCAGFTEDQVDMTTEEAIDLIVAEGWLDENVSITMSDTIDDLVKKGYIKKDTPLYDYITDCSDASTGDYLTNSPGCVTPEVANSAGEVLPCNAGEICSSAPETEMPYVNDPRSLKAMSVFLADYQMLKNLNGEDEEGTGTASGTGTTPGSGTPAGQPALGPDDGTCDPRTTPLGSITQAMPGDSTTATLCGIPSITSVYADPVPGANGQAVVRAEVSTAYQNLGEAAAAAGFNLTVGDAFRTNALQSIRNNGGTADTNAATSTGSSRHEQGIAMDFKVGDNEGFKDGATCADRQVGFSEVYNWLRNNSYKFGIYQYAAEPWHFDTSTSASRCTSP